MRFFGQATLKETLEYFRDLERDPLRQSELDVFLDLYDVETLPLVHELWSVVMEMRRIRKVVSFRACAILVRTDALFGMMRMYETFSEGLFIRSKTFRERVSAEAWLNTNRTATSNTVPQ